MRIYYGWIHVEKIQESEDKEMLKRTKCPKHVSCYQHPVEYIFLTVFWWKKRMNKKCIEIVKEDKKGSTNKSILEATLLQRIRKTLF